MLAGESLLDLPPSKLEELAGWVGNQGMAELLELQAGPAEETSFRMPEGELEFTLYREPSITLWDRCNAFLQDAGYAMFFLGPVILVVAVLALAIYVKTQMPQTGTSVTTTKVVYQMKLNNQPEYMLSAIQIGDEMFDKERSTGGSLGTIIDIEVSPGTDQGELDDGTVAYVPAEGYYDILLTIEGDALIGSDGSVALNRIYDLGVNSHRNFNTKYAYFLGMVTDIQIQGADSAQ